MTDPAIWLRPFPFASSLHASSIANAFNSRPSASNEIDIPIPTSSTTNSTNIGLTPTASANSPPIRGRTHDQHLHSNNNNSNNNNNRHPAIRRVTSFLSSAGARNGGGGGGGNGSGNSGGGSRSRSRGAAVCTGLAPPVSMLPLTEMEPDGYDDNGRDGNGIGDGLMRMVDTLRGVMMAKRDALEAIPVG